MKLREWLDEWSMTSLKINAKFLEMEWKPKDVDKDAAWELYVELITRITTQQLQPDQGDEAAALNSIYKLFDLTRDVIKKNGRHCQDFTRIAVTVLNQKIRPFTAKWHKISKADGFKDAKTCLEFRAELEKLQVVLRNYTLLLANLADVEDLTDIGKRG